MLKNKKLTLRNLLQCEMKYYWEKWEKSYRKNEEDDNWKQHPIMVVCGAQML